MRRLARLESSLLAAASVMLASACSTEDADPPAPGPAPQPAPGGGWSELGRIAELEEGCNWDPTLETTAELLPRTVNPRFRARLRYLRAEALSSIIAFHQLGQLRAAVVDDVEQVRQEALDGDRAALQGDPTVQDREQAWVTGWSVATSQPVAPRYDCRRA